MWHRAGTITVTKGSKTVTGAGGTAWVQNIRVGDALQGPDGRYYEVTNVASDTALSIEPAYMGNTASGQWYQILPILGQQKRLADRAAELVGAVGLLPGEVQSNERRIANAEQAMLAKIGNLAGLQNLKQSQLNLGVIQSLVGEVFSTDNCTIIENEYGVAFRNPKGLQLCVSPPLTLLYTHALYLETTWRFPAAFGRLLTVQATFRGNAGNQINWPDPYRAHIAYATTSNAQTNVALYPPTGKVWASNSSATGVFAFSLGMA